MDVVVEKNPETCLPLQAKFLYRKYCTGGAAYMKQDFHGVNLSFKDLSCESQ